MIKKPFAALANVAKASFFLKNAITNSITANALICPISIPILNEIIFINKSSGFKGSCCNLVDNPRP